MMSTTPYGHEQSDDERDLEEVRYRRALVTLRLLQGAFALSVLVMLATVVYVVVQVHNTQLEGTPTGRKLVASANQILSCTTTNGKCSVANRKQSAKLIAGLYDNQTRAAAASAFCADKPERQTFDQIFACTVRTMAAQPHP